MSVHSNPPSIQEVAVPDLTGIEIRATRLDLIVESDDSLDDVAQLLADPGSGAPELTSRGSRLVVTQEGRYRGSSTPVLRLPAVELPTLAANISRGNLTLEQIEASVAVNIDSGNLTVRGGVGDIAVNVSSGDAMIRQREGNIACRVDSGQLDLSECRGNLALNLSSGNVGLRDCHGGVDLQLSKGDVTVLRPVDQRLRISSSKGNVQIQGGTLVAADVDSTRGNIASTARLLYSEAHAPVEDPDELDEFEAAIDDVVESVDEEVRFNLGSVEFIAGDSGMRISTGGTERIVAGPDGLVVRRGDGSPLFVANERGVSTGPAARRSGNEQFRFKTGRGNISLDVPQNQPARVELIVNRGDVQSDIPLVEVGRPGPRSSTRRYVGTSNSSESERILIRARTSRGDIRLRSAIPVREPARQQSGESNRARQRREILRALAEGRLTPDEADVLLAAMERESG